MNTFIISTFIIVLAEIGDKTQLLSLILVARYKKPWIITYGILFSTILNHSLAGYIGNWLMNYFGQNVMTWILGISFIAMAIWTLIPDKTENEIKIFYGVFLTTTIIFFLAEMGDKTQIATIILAAKYETDYLWVIAGTTFGMLLANIPVVFLGNQLLKKIPISKIRFISAGIFLTLGVWTLLI